MNQGLLHTQMKCIAGSSLNIYTKITMAKPKHYQPSHRERMTLIVCIIIIIAFLLFVAIATSGSLSYYTIPHAILVLALVCVLLFLNMLPKIAIRLCILLGIIGAAIAVGLTFAYLPYYSQYLEHLKEIRG